MRLLRIRNPWGQGHGEWRGAWSDNAPEWKTVDEVDRSELDVQFGPDGEFWMRLDDYVKYFHTTSVCSLAPDFDRDGLDDGLSQYNDTLNHVKQLMYLALYYCTMHAFCFSMWLTHVIDEVARWSQST